MTDEKTEIEKTDNDSLSMSQLITRAALLLGTFALLSTLLITLTHQSTAEKIAQNKKDFILKSLNEVLPNQYYDNDILTDSFTIDNSDLGENAVIYPAFMQGKPSGAILTVTAPNGYNGKIKILVGIKDINGKAEIISSRVVEHQETPGLGDAIEAKKSNWIFQFDQKSLTSPSEENWLVIKDGGEFDQLTGATITPRAVTQAIKQALLYYQNNHKTIFDAKQ